MPTPSPAPPFSSPISQFINSPTLKPLEEPLVVNSGDDPAVENARSPRLLHVVAGNLYGGVESYLATVARLGRTNAMLDHQFAVCYPGRLLQELNSQHAAVHLLGQPRMSRPWSVWRSRSRLARVIRERQIDVVVTHGSWAHLLCGPTAKRAGAKLAYFTHDSLSHLGYLDRLAGRTRPDVVLANSRFTLDGARGLFPYSPAEVCYLPVESSNVSQKERAAVRSELRVRDDQVVIIQASRLERWKGHGLLLDALARVSVENWELWFVGGVQRPHEAAYQRELEAAAAKLGISSSVRFLGQRDDVRRLLVAADIYCQANLQPEPFGIAFIEALYAGLPVVTSDFGGGREILDGRCGALFPPENAEALSELLRELIENREARTRVASGGPLRAAELCDFKRHTANFRRTVLGMLKFST